MIRRGKASGERLEACGGRRSSKSRGRRNRAGNRADAMKTGGNRPRHVRARRKRAGIDRIYAVARQTSRSRAFTTGAGRCSFTERGEEKRRRRRRPCFLAAEAEAEACRSLLESTSRTHLPRVCPCISSWLLESTRGSSAQHLQLLPVRTCSPASVRLVCSLPPLWSPLQTCFPPLPLFLSLPPLPSSSFVSFPLPLFLSLRH